MKLLSYFIKRISIFRLQKERHWHRLNRDSNSAAGSVYLWLSIFREKFNHPNICGVHFCLGTQNSQFEVLTVVVLKSICHVSDILKYLCAFIFSVMQSTKSVQQDAWPSSCRHCCPFKHNGVTSQKTCIFKHRTDIIIEIHWNLLKLTLRHFPT